MPDWISAWRNTDSAPLPRRSFSSSSAPRLSSSSADRTNSSPEQTYDVGTLTVSLEDAQRRFFDQTANDWISETRAQSATGVIMARPEFTELRSMGRVAVKFALERMNRGEIRLHWFLLLKAASGQDPVPASSRGIIAEMADAWLSWGRSETLIEA